MVDATPCVYICGGVIVVLFLARVVYLIADKVRKNWNEYKDVK